MNTVYSSIAAALALASSIWPAYAIDVEKVHVQTASGFCQPALPVFDGTIRKRPTAIANEGSGTAFVSCALSGAQGQDEVGFVYMVLRNRGNTAVRTTCSLVHGLDAGATTYPISQEIPAGAVATFAWNSAVLVGGPTFSFYNFSCGLPPRVEIAHGYYNFVYEDN